jgi:hypothetical protein
MLTWVGITGPDSIEVSEMDSWEQEPPSTIPGMTLSFMILGLLIHTIMTLGSTLGGFVMVGLLIIDG